jgi:hypothetical protein
MANAASHYRINTFFAPREYKSVGEKRKRDHPVLCHSFSPINASVTLATQSATSGKTGGLAEVERLKAARPFGQ